MNELDIPIDIHSNKLLDWLISRRHCSKNWHENILKIREKISNAIQDMPAHEDIVKLLSGTHINYFHCLKIVEILKETEKDSKNIFGMYGSKRMKDWTEIINLYEKENIYLAEAAQILTRNTNYEVPSLKKQIVKFEQLQNEYLKKEKDYLKSENIARNEFNQSCKQLGITGKQIRKELTNLLLELPEIYEKIALNFKNIQQPVELYSEFLNFNSVKQDIETLPLLKFLKENGNTTVYQWVYNEKPLTVEEPELNLVEEISDFGNMNIDSQIDFGATGEIDFGDVKLEGDIDWGNVDSQDIQSEEINFDINLEESGIIVEKSGVDGGVAKDKEAYSILDNPETRNQVLNEILELESFLKMRLYELSSENDLLSISQMQNAPSILQIQTVETITSMLDSVQIISSELTNKRTAHLHNIKHSPKYLDILVNSLKQKLNITEKMQESRKIVVEKAEDARKQALAIQPIINLIVDKTKILQEQIEKEISKKYKNRIVNIIGGVKLL